MGSTGLKKHGWLVFFLLAAGCGSQSKSPEPGADPSPPPSQSDNAAAATPAVDSWSTNRTFGVTWSWLTPVKAETFVDAEFTVTGPAGLTLATVSEVQITPWMPSMGHGTSTADQEITPLAGSPGKFRVRGMYFIMGGPWEIKLAATVDSVKDRASIKVLVE
jgi:hypothetical protein